MRYALAVMLLVACGGKKNEEPPPPPPVIADAAIDGITTIGDFDPNSGAHLDDGNGNGSGSDRPPQRRSKGGPPIGIMLKSVPSGATISVDGIELGKTPKYWSGVADGNEHDFAFTLSGYALARYKFVPISSGTLHATLTRVAGGETIDAGLEPVIAPKLAPDAAVAPKPDASVAPPPTVLSPPVDAPPVAPKPDAAIVAPPAPVDAARVEPSPTGPDR